MAWKSQWPTSKAVRHEGFDTEFQTQCVKNSSGWSKGSGHPGNGASLLVSCWFSTSGLWVSWVAALDSVPHRQQDWTFLWWDWPLSVWESRAAGSVPLHLGGWSRSALSPSHCRRPCPGHQCGLGTLVVLLSIALLSGQRGPTCLSFGRSWLSCHIPSGMWYQAWHGYSQAPGAPHAWASDPGLTHWPPQGQTDTAGCLLQSSCRWRVSQAPVPPSEPQ